MIGARSGHLKPRHYQASEGLAVGGPVRAFADAGRDDVALACWRVGAVDLVDQVNDAHPTLLFHVAGGQVLSEPCNRFRAQGLGWPGEAMMIPVDGGVRCRWHDPVDYLHVYFRPGYVEGVAAELFGQKLTELQDRSHVREPSLTRTLRRLVQRQWDAIADPLQAAALAHALALACVQSFSPANGPVKPIARAFGPRRLRRVLDYIEARVAEPITVADLAAVAGISPSHFAHAFGREIGVSPYRFVLQRRVEQAKRLIDAGVGLKAVAQMAGFASEAHLTTIFRQSSGLTPGHWRQRGFA